MVWWAFRARGAGQTARGRVWHFARKGVGLAGVQMARGARRRDPDAGFLPPDREGLGAGAPILGGSNQATTLATFARVADPRWATKGCFEVAKQGVGLASHEIRSWHGWYRHITLAMPA